MTPSESVIVDPIENTHMARAARAQALGTAGAYQTPRRSRGHPSRPAIAVSGVHQEAHRSAPRSPGHARMSSTVTRSTVAAERSRPV